MFALVLFVSTPLILGVITTIVYKDAAAVGFHRDTPHYKAWTDFKAEGGVVSQTVIKADAIDFTY